MTVDTNLDLLDNDPVFNLKGGMLTVTVIEVVRLDTGRFARQLGDKAAQAPNLFRDTPVVLSLEKLDAHMNVSTLAGLLQICRNHGLLPVALRGSDNFRPLAQQSGLVLMPPGRGRDRTVDMPVSDEAPAPAENPAKEDTPEPAAAPGQNRIVTQPIRSGQQVYAPGGDLIVMAPVSAGSELLADGNIHVYGPLRGRALAGVRGDTQARIFCQSLEAELVSIAGHYKVAEDLRKESLWKNAVHVCLDGDSLKIAAL
ncbi:septum site-determining protein MinC [Halopseudomonas salina]|uniref:Probable septum site-determining protein MinC n=1 Tax=Halopseudomonas salina TaxID=1323744 RepID=A0ABQ1NXX8_9GAMM|nr:septum site-determining protein MinC [Halopseudomonas salina]GGC86892.1 putative septum site-determining protein MinC [Halopseudomonas salina]